MKAKVFISLLSFLLLTFISYGQDSIRTRNDKPGTPQSLRTTNNAPRNKVHVVETQRPQQQGINHGATENTIDNSNRQQKVSPVISNSGEKPQTPTITIEKESTQSTIRRDSTTNKGTMGNGQSNATNPIRK